MCTYLERYSCSLESKNINNAIRFLYIPIQCRIIFQQPYRVLADITPCIRIVVAETIVIQSRLRILILPLILKRNECGWPFPLPAVDVQLLFPHLVALLVVGLHGCAEVVGDDGETAAVGNKLGGRHERVLLEEPSDHLIFFRPLVQWKVAVPMCSIARVMFLSY